MFVVSIPKKLLLMLAQIPGVLRVSVRRHYESLHEEIERFEGQAV